MKIKLDVSHERYFELKALFEKCGFEIDDDADLVLSECNRFIDTLMVRDTASNEKVFLPIKDIVYIETYGHTVEVHTDKKHIKHLTVCTRFMVCLTQVDFCVSATPL